LKVSIADLQSKEDLVLSKLVWAKDSRSSIQLEDIRLLLESGCDIDYLTKWASELGVWELFQEFSK
jgi:hypothetical protein